MRIESIRLKTKIIKKKKKSNQKNNCQSYFFSSLNVRTIYIFNLNILVSVFILRHSQLFRRQPFFQYFCFFFFFGKMQIIFQKTLALKPWNVWNKQNMPKKINKMDFFCKILELEAFPSNILSVIMEAYKWGPWQQCAHWTMLLSKGPFINYVPYVDNQGGRICQMSMALHKLMQ